MGGKRFSGGAGPSQRQLKVGELIRRALSDVLTRGDVHDPDLSRSSITVSEVRASPDLRQALVFVMPLGGVAVDETLAALNRSKRELRHQVARAVKLKYSPDLRFVVDNSFDRMDETRRLLSEDRVRRDIEQPGPDAED